MKATQCSDQVTRPKPLNLLVNKNMQGLTIHLHNLSGPHIFMENNIIKNLIKIVLFFNFIPICIFLLEFRVQALYKQQ